MLLIEPCQKYPSLVEIYLIQVGCKPNFVFVWNKISDENSKMLKTKELSTLNHIMDSTTCIPNKTTVQYQQKISCKSSYVVYLWRQYLDKNCNLKHWTKVFFNNWNAKDLFLIPFRHCFVIYYGNRQFFTYVGFFK